MKLSKMKKEDLELLSYSKIAELYLKEHKEKLNTADLFREVCNLLSLNEEEYQGKIADFFEALTTSKEFILLKDGTWDLKENHTVKIDIDEIYEEKEDDEIEETVSEDDEETIEDNYDSNEEDYDEDLNDLSIISEDDIIDEE